MIAAIYARKSTEQLGVNDDQKSVARQIEQARRYAASKGWTVGDIYDDEGISGAEFANRPGFVRLLNALKPRPSFEVLIVSDLDRLGRDGVETPYAVKQLNMAGVQVFAYLDDKEIRLDSPLTTLITQVQAFGAAIEREKARQRTYDAMAQKARAGHVTGGRVFGYRNVDVMTGAVDGTGRATRAHVRREIEEREAVVVRRIFALSAEGAGMKLIAITLNDAGAPSPRAQQGRPNGWSPSSVREVLYRDLYRGEIVWNRTRKRNRWGQTRVAARPETEWLRTSAPDLRIVSDEQWTAAHARLDKARQTYLRATDGTLWGKPASGTLSKYLLTGLARCGACGGSLIVKSRDHGRKRSFRYACGCYHQRGRAVCANGLEAMMEAADRLVIEALETDLLAPAVINGAIDHALGRLGDLAAGRGDQLAATRAAIERLDGERARLTAAIAAGGDMDALLVALREREAARTALQADADRLAGVGAVRMDRAGMERKLRARLDEWRGLLGQQVAWTRQILAKLITGKIVLTPTTDSEGAPAYEIRIPFTFEPLFLGILCPKGMASPAGTADRWQLPVRGYSDLKAA